MLHDYGGLFASVLRRAFFCSRSRRLRPVAPCFASGGGQRRVPSEAPPRRRPPYAQLFMGRQDGDGEEQKKTLCKTKI